MVIQRLLEILRKLGALNEKKKIRKTLAEISLLLHRVSWSTKINFKCYVREADWINLQILNEMLTNSKYEHLFNDCFLELKKEILTLINVLDNFAKSSGEKLERCEFIALSRFVANFHFDKVKEKLAEHVRILQNKSPDEEIEWLYYLRIISIVADYSNCIPEEYDSAEMRLSSQIVDHLITRPELLAFLSTNIGLVSGIKDELIGLCRAILNCAKVSDHKKTMEGVIKINELEVLLKTLATVQKEDSSVDALNIYIKNLFFHISYMIKIVTSKMNMGQDGRNKFLSLLEYMDNDAPFYSAVEYLIISISKSVLRLSQRMTFATQEGWLTEHSFLLDRLVFCVDANFSEIDKNLLCWCFVNYITKLQGYFRFPEKKSLVSNLNDVNSKQKIDEKILANYPSIVAIATRYGIEEKQIEIINPLGNGHLIDFEICFLITKYSMLFREDLFRIYSMTYELIDLLELAVMVYVEQTDRVAHFSVEFVNLQKRVIKKEWENIRKHRINFYDYIKRLYFQQLYFNVPRENSYTAFITKDSLIHFTRNQEADKLLDFIRNNRLFPEFQNCSTNQELVISVAKDRYETLRRALARLSREKDEEFLDFLGSVDDSLGGLKNKCLSRKGLNEDDFQEIINLYKRNWKIENVYTIFGIVQFRETPFFVSEDLLTRMLPDMLYRLMRQIGEAIREQEFPKQVSLYFEVDFVFDSRIDIRLQWEKLKLIPTKLKKNPMLRADFSDLLQQYVEYQKKIFIIDMIKVLIKHHESQASFDLHQSILSMHSLVIQCILSDKAKLNEEIVSDLQHHLHNLSKEILHTAYMRRLLVELMPRVSIVPIKMGLEEANVSVFSKWLIKNIEVFINFYCLQGDEHKCDDHLGMKRSELYYFVDKVMASRDKSVFASPVFSYLSSNSVSQEYINTLPGKTIKVLGNPVSMQLLRAPNPLTRKKNPQYNQKKAFMIEALKNTLEIPDGDSSPSLSALYCNWHNELVRLEGQISKALQRYDRKAISISQFFSETQEAVDEVGKFVAFNDTLPKGVLATYHRTQKLFSQETRSNVQLALKMEQPMKISDSSSIVAKETRELAPVTVEQTLFIPADGDCLFISILLILLLQAIDDDERFIASCKRYIDSILTEQAIKFLKDELRANYKNLNYLRNPRFKSLVTYFKINVGITSAWGNEEDMQLIADKFGISMILKSVIEKAQVVQYGEIIPQNGTGINTTITILKCVANTDEAIALEDDIGVRMAKKASIRTDQHGQHFRAILDFDLRPVLTQSVDNPKIKVPISPKRDIVLLPQPQEIVRTNLVPLLRKNVTNSELSEFSQWFNRLCYIVITYKQGMLSKENLVCYQLYLMDLGQFVANFTQDELIRLGYPRSPFTLMNENDYLRSIDNWSMEILGVGYQRQISQKYKQATNIYPLWIASTSFLSVLKNFRKNIEVITSEEFTSKIQHYLVKIQNDEDGLLIIVAEKDNFELIKLQLFRELAMNNEVEEDQIKKHIEIIKNGDELPSDDEEFEDDSIVETLKKFKEMVDKILITFIDEFNGVDVFSILGKNDLVEIVREVAQKTGYKTDPKNINCAILSLFKGFFVDAVETLNCLSYYKEADVFEFDETRELLAIFELVIQETCKRINSDPVEFIGVDIGYTIGNFKQSHTNFHGIYQIYADFISSLLAEIEVRFSDPAFIAIIGKELYESLQNFIQSPAKNQLSIAVRSVQCLAEILLLHYSLSGNNPIFNLKKLPSPLISFRTHVSLTTYAMRSFTRALQVVLQTIDQMEPISIFVTTRNYYEWLENLDELHAAKITVKRVNQLSEMDVFPTIVFMELHPNDVTATKQFQLDPRALSVFLSKNPERSLTVVIDITLNSLEDPELRELFDSVASQLKSGQLNLILIQSLTKFSQLGLDKRSGGLFDIYNNNSGRWQRLNQMADEIAKNEPIDIATERYFCHFLKKNNLVRRYIETIGQRARYVYLKTLSRMNELEVPDTGCFQITFSSDEKACYLALNMFGLFAKLDYGFYKDTNDDKLDNIANDILEFLVLPLMLKYGLPVTERLSIGFPLTTVDVALGSIRLKFGLESESEIDQYIEVLVYTSFVLNCFFKDHKLRINILDKETREKFMNEKYLQYLAMTPEFSEEAYECNYLGEYGLQRILHFSMGRMIYKQQLMPNGGFKEYCEDEIVVMLRDVGGPVRLSSLDDLAVRRMIAASFTNLDNFSCEKKVNIAFNRTIEIQFEYLKLNNIPMVYGGFRFQDEIFFLSLRGFQCDIYSKMSYEKEFKIDGRNLFIKQGHLIMSLELMPLDEREFMLREAAFMPNKNSPIPSQIRDLTYMTWLPTNSIINLLCPFDRGLLLEFDTISFSSDCVTVYKRFIDAKSTCITIDFWGVKNPNHVRFLNIITAVVIKKLIGCQCIAYDEKYNHLIYDIQFENIDTVVIQAVDIILPLMTLLINKLSNRASPQSTCNYDLLNRTKSSFLKWPSGRSAVTYVRNKDLIDHCLSILDLPNKIPALQSKSQPQSRRSLFVETVSSELSFIRGSTSKASDQSSLSSNSLDRKM